MTDEISEIGIAVVGCGYWGPNLVRNCANTKGFNLVAVGDRDASVRARMTTLYPGATAYEELEDVLADEAVEAVVIATPSGLHFDHAKAALKAGKHVLVEKPLSETVEEAQQLIDLAAANGRQLMVGHTFLYNNIVHDVKRRLDEGELGKLHYIYAQRLNLGRFRQDSDVVWTLAPHDISILNYWMDGRPHQVSARGFCMVNVSVGLAEVAYCHLEYPNGTNCHLHLSWLDPQKRRETVLVGDGKMLIYDEVNSDRHIQIYDKGVVKEFQEQPHSFSDFSSRIRAGDLVVPNIRLKEPLATEIAAFEAAIRTDTAPIADGANGLEVTAVLEAMSRSMELNGAVVSVQYPD